MLWKHRLLNEKATCLAAKHKMFMLEKRKDVFHRIPKSDLICVLAPLCFDSDSLITNVQTIYDVKVDRL